MAGRTMRVITTTLGAALRGQLANKADFAMAVANGVTYQVTIVLFATVIFGHFPPLQGWTVGEVLLVSSIRLLGHGCHVMVFGNLALVPYLIREDRLDAWRLRPAGLFLQICTHQAPVNAVGDVVVAITSLVICLDMIQIDWSPLTVAEMVAAVLIATVIELALVMHIVAIGFRWRGSDSLLSWLDALLTQFAGYPTSIFPKVVGHLLTFALPLGFIAFYPAAWVLDKTVPGGTVFIVLTPLVAALWLATAVMHWRSGLKAFARGES